MYFPILENLKNENIYEQDIKLFDRWLGSRPKNTWKYLNPLQFAIDCSFNEELATNIFVLCSVKNEIDLFEVRSIIRCPNCGSVIAKEIGVIISHINENNCFECGIELDYELLKDETEIYFSLKNSHLIPFVTNI